MRPDLPLLLAVALAVALAAGCAGAPRQRDVEPAAPPPPSRDSIQAAQLARYLLDLQTVVEGNPTQRAEVVASARAGYDQAKLGPAALRYGLLLAAPGHAARDPAQAQRLLIESLAHAELLSPPERGLAALQLAQVEAELRLTAEVDRLAADLQRERERQGNATATAALTRRLQAEVEETARLRKALDEARAKLEAITRIERNFSDLPAVPEGRNP